MRFRVSGSAIAQQLGGKKCCIWTGSQLGKAAVRAASCCLMVLLLLPSPSRAAAVVIFLFIAVVKPHCFRLICPGIHFLMNIILPTFRCIVKAASGRENWTNWGKCGKTMLSIRPLINVQTENCTFTYYLQPQPAGHACSQPASQL